MTIEEFKEYVLAQGYFVEAINGADGNSYLVVRDVELPKGSLRGRRCDVAIRHNAMIPLCAARRDTHAAPSCPDEQ